MKIKLGVVVGGVAAVAVLAFGLTQLNLGKGGQGRISLRQEVPVTDSRDTGDTRGFDAMEEFYPEENVRSSYVAPDVIDIPPVTTVTADVFSEGLGDAKSDFKLKVCAPSNLAKVHLQYKSTGSTAKVLDWKNEGGSTPLYKSANGTVAKEVNVENGDIWLLSKDENSSSCVGGVEWIIYVENSKKIAFDVMVPYYVGHVVVYVTAFDDNSGTLGEMVIVSHDVL